MSQSRKIKIGGGEEERAEIRDGDNDKPDPVESPGDPEPGEDVSAADPVQDLESQLTAKEKEAQENYDRLLRVSAEFENYKKRSARDFSDFKKYANRALLKDMLSVVDNLELAIQSAGEKNAHAASLLEGLNMTLQEMLRVFEKHGVKPLESVGQPFDPALHEAMMQEQTDDQPENTVVREMQKGYLLNDRLLRPAMVVVAKSQSDADGNESQSGE
jgi:molecular chaperone GrpE